MAKEARLFKPVQFLSLNDTLTSGITKVDSTLPICTLNSHYTADGIRYRTILDVNSLKKTISADAALAFGEKLAMFPVGLIQPIGGYVKLTSLTATGLSATAGEVGLGSVIGSGAVATLGGTATFENFMEGTTLSNHVAATTLTSYKANRAPVAGTTATMGVQVLDGSVTPANLHLNIASTWDQTAAEAVTFSARVCVDWIYVGNGAE